MRRRAIRNTNPRGIWVEILAVIHAEGMMLREAVGVLPYENAAGLCEQGRTQ